MPTILDTENWMSHLNMDVKVVDTVIPASHDASSYPTTDLIQTFENTWVGSVTQVADYAAQLNAGVRYFDMRVTVDDKQQLRMKHAGYKFESLESVLKQLRAFSDAHPGEYIFLDLNPDTIDVARSTVAALIKVLADNDLTLVKKKLSTAHLTNEGGTKKFNPNITWRGLGDARFVVTLYADDSDPDKNNTLAQTGLQELVKSQSFLSDSRNFRTSPFGPDSFGPNYWTTAQIEYYLYCKLRDWNKSCMMITQLINTPLLSPVPGDSAAACDLRFVDTANRWSRVVGGLENGPPKPADLTFQYTYTGVPKTEWVHTPGSGKTWWELVFPPDKPQPSPLFSADGKWLGPRPNVVFRDMVNAGYNRTCIHTLIRANSFSTSPDITLTDLVKKRNTVRFRVDGHASSGESSYLCVDPQTKVMKLTTNWWDPSCKFLLLGYEPTDTQDLVYSGSAVDYTIQDKRAFRMVQPPKADALNTDAKCMTVAPIQNTVSKLDGQVYWGMTWAESQDRETFACIDPDNIEKTGSIYFGGRVVIRTMYGAAKNTAEEIAQKFKNEVLPEAAAGIAAVCLTPVAAIVGSSIGGGVAGPVGLLAGGVGAVAALWVAALKTGDAVAQTLLANNRRFTFLQANGGLVFATSPGWDAATTFVIEQEVPKNYVQPAANPLRGAVGKTVSSSTGTVVVTDPANSTNKLGWVVLGTGTKYSWVTDRGEPSEFPDLLPPDATSLVSGRKISVDWGPLAQTGYAVAQSVAIVNPYLGPTVSGIVAVSVQAQTAQLVVVDPTTKAIVAQVYLSGGTKWNWVVGLQGEVMGLAPPDYTELKQGRQVKVASIQLPGKPMMAVSVSIVNPNQTTVVTGMVAKQVSSVADPLVLQDQTTKAILGPFAVTKYTMCTVVDKNWLPKGSPHALSTLPLGSVVRISYIQPPGGVAKVVYSVALVDSTGIAYP